MALEAAKSERPAAIPADVRALVASRGLAEPDPVRSTLKLAAMTAVTVLAAAVAIRVDNLAVWVAYWVVGSLYLLGLAGAQHAAGHGSLYRSGPANRVVGMMISLPLLLPHALYRANHYEHHNNTHAEGDTEPHDLYTALWQYFLIVPIIGVGFLAFLFKDLVLTVGGHPPTYLRSSAQRRFAAFNAVVLAVAIAVLVMVGLWSPAMFVRVWLVPFLGATVILLPMVLSPEHYACGWGPASPLSTTRTTESNAVLRFVYWGTNWHTAHHLVPSVPGHRLHELHQLIADRCEYVTPGYLRWHLELIRQIRRGELPESAPWLESPTIDLTDAATTGARETDSAPSR